MQMHSNLCFFPVDVQHGLNLPCGMQEPNAAHSHEPVIDKMRHNFGGGNQTVCQAPAR